MTLNFMTADTESAIPSGSRVRLQLASQADFAAAACLVSNWAGPLPVEVVTDGGGNPAGAWGFNVDSTWCATQGALILSGSTNLCPLTAATTVNIPVGVNTCTPTPTTVAVTVTPPAPQTFSRGHAATAPAATAAQSPALGYPVRWSAEPPLPEGLFIDPASGVIQGTPLFAAPQRPYVVKATTRSGVGTATVNLAVAPTAVTVATVAAQTWAHGSAITPVQASATDSDPAITTFTWAISPALPAAVSLNPATGQITGTPAAAASQTPYTLTATDTNGASGSTTFNITVT